MRVELKLLINEHDSNDETLTQINSLKASILNIVSSKIGWLKGEHTLQLFHSLLIAHGFITCDFDAFKIHFVGNNGTMEYIQWNSQTTRLVYLFNQLLTEHFINHEGKKFSNGTLRTSLNNVLNNKKSSETIDSIIKELIRNSY